MKKNMRHFKKLLQFDRPNCDDQKLNGYVLDYNDYWTILHYENDFELNGYTVIRNDLIKRYRELNDYRKVTKRALKRFGHIPKSPGAIDLKDINSVLISVNKIFPLITVHRELRDNTVCFIGSIAKITPKTITLAEISPGAEFAGLHRINSGEITKIDFGARYEKTLWELASIKTRNRITRP